MRLTWLLPGRVAASGLVGPDDLPLLRGLGILSILSLTEEDPLRDAEGGDLKRLHVPVADMGVPGDEDLDRAVAFLEDEFVAGRPVLAHCFAGYGRTGTVLACFLVRRGRGAEAAIDEVRAARPGSIETDEQEECVRAFAAREAAMASPLRVLVNGAKGRMGGLAVSVVRSAEGLVLAGETDKGDDLAAAIRSGGADVVVDFTHHSVALPCFRTIVEAGAAPVSGTSGWGETEIEEARRLLARGGGSGAVVPNFSLGAVLMMRFAEEAARHFPHCEVVEIHHDRKADSPSGTAERTAEMVAKARGEAPPEKVAESERHPGARGARIRGVRVHSLRLPGALAHQEVLFSGEGEILTIRHDSLSRDSFRRGILLAVRNVRRRPGLAVGLEAFLG